MTHIPSLPRSMPEAQGIPSAAISGFIGAAERELDALHSFMLLRHGHVVTEGWWEPYRPLDAHMLFSLSKSFTSTAIGFLVAEDRLSVDELVLAFFPEDAPPEPSANLKAMRVRHLLSMSTGHPIDTTEPMTRDPSGSWVRGFLAQPVQYEPGTHFLYNTGATYMLSAIVHSLCGGRMLDYLQPRLFTPLGVANPRWETSPQGIDTGGWGLAIPTAGIAAFGQLYLQKGWWQGHQLLPESWVEAATARQVASENTSGVDWEQGYGYQFWRCRHGAYRGDGAFGQYCLVMPAQDAVLAITAGLDAMQSPLDLVWEYLLPAMGSAPLPDDARAQAALANTLAHLHLRTPQGVRQSPTAARVSGKWFTVDENEEQITAIRFDFDDAETRLGIRNAQGEQQIACGHERWVRGAASLGPLDPPTGSVAPRQAASRKVGASGAWTDEQTYTAKLWWYETPFAHTLTCRFEGDHMTLEHRPHVGFGLIERARLHGRLA